MTSRAGVDGLLDDHARLVAQKAAVEGHLWASEFLLHRISKLLPHLIADSAHNAVARDVLADEIRELLAEDRPHGTSDSILLAGAAGQPGPIEGTGEKDGPS